MKERLEAARARLAELQAVENPGEPDPHRGSICYLDGVIKHLEQMLDPQK